LRADTAASCAALAEQGHERRGRGHARLHAHAMAEPITLGHFMAAHAWGLVRDHERLATRGGA
jgi:argininosuccinate lyase